MSASATLHRDLRRALGAALRAPRTAFQHPPVRLARRVVFRDGSKLDSAMAARSAAPGNRVAHGRDAAMARAAG